MKILFLGIYLLIWTVSIKENYARQHHASQNKSRKCKDTEQCLRRCSLKGFTGGVCYKKHCLCFNEPSSNLKDISGISKKSKDAKKSHLTKQVRKKRQSGYQDYDAYLPNNVPLYDYAVLPEYGLPQEQTRKQNSFGRSRFTRPYYAYPEPWTSLSGFYDSEQKKTYLEPIQMAGDPDTQNKQYSPLYYYHPPPWSSLNGFYDSIPSNENDFVLPPAVAQPSRTVVPTRGNSYALPPAAQQPNTNFVPSREDGFVLPPAVTQPRRTLVPTRGNSYALPPAAQQPNTNFVPSRENGFVLPPTAKQPSITSDPATRNTLMLPPEAPYPNKNAVPTRGNTFTLPPVAPQQNRNFGPTAFALPQAETQPNNLVPSRENRFAIPTSATQPAFIHPLVRNNQASGPAYPGSQNTQQQFTTPVNSLPMYQPINNQLANNQQKNPATSGKPSPNSTISKVPFYPKPLTQFKPYLYGNIPQSPESYLQLTNQGFPQNQQAQTMSASSYGQPTAPAGVPQLQNFNQNLPPFVEFPPEPLLEPLYPIYAEAYPYWYYPPLPIPPFGYYPPPPPPYYPPIPYDYGIPIGPYTGGYETPYAYDPNLITPMAADTSTSSSNAQAQSTESTKGKHTVGEFSMEIETDDGKVKGNSVIDTQEKTKKQETIAKARSQSETIRQVEDNAPAGKVAPAAATANAALAPEG